MRDPCDGENATSLLQASYYQEIITQLKPL